MKKKLKVVKVTAVILAVAFCTLLGCERKEKEAGELLLPLEEAGEPAAALAGLEGSGSGTENSDSGIEGETAARNETLPEAFSETVAGIPEQTNGTMIADQEAEKEESVCVVHICGAVREPGVYIMDEGSRIYQAVEKAGGFEAEADENYLNQADLLIDGMKIYVPTRAEVEASGGEIEWKTSGNSGAEAAGGKEPREALKESGLPVNINTAGEAELTTIPGVGSSKAKSIIAYREKNGMYRTIEDIMNVEGIKDGVFQKIKDYITV